MKLTKSGPSTGTGPNSRQPVHRPVNKTDSSEKIASHARKLQQEVVQLRKKLAVLSEKHMTKWRSLDNEENSIIKHFCV